MVISYGEFSSLYAHPNRLERYYRQAYSNSIISNIDSATKLQPPRFPYSPIAIVTLGLLQTP